MARSAFRRRLHHGVAGPIPAGWCVATSLTNWVADRTGGQLSWADVVAIATAIRHIEGATMQWQGRTLIRSGSIPDPIESLLP